MIDQTIPTPQLFQGMARCVREWILPHVNDPMAATQAELLASLLEELPKALAAQAADAIRRDTDAARELLGRLDTGDEESGDSTQQYRTVDELLAENSAYKKKLEQLAASLRGETSAASAEQLRVLRGFFAQSLARELGAGAGEGTDFKSMSAKDRAARRDG